MADSTRLIDPLLRFEVSVGQPLVDGAYVEAAGSQTSHDGTVPDAFGKTTKKDNQAIRNLEDVWILCESIIYTFILCIFVPSGFLASLGSPFQFTSPWPDHHPRAPEGRGSDHFQT